MAWTYYCEDDKTTLRAESKEGLVDEVINHLKEGHMMQMSRDDARASVEKNAKQEAA